MALQRSPKQYLGVRAVAPPDLTIADRAPGSTDTAFLRGQLWLDKTNEASYQYSGTTWIALGSGTTGAVVSLTGDSGGAIVPVAGNIDVLGDSTDGVSVVGTAGTLTINVAAASTTQRGTLETSTDAESVTGTSTVVAVTPASLTARLAAPGAIGGTTPAAGTFTTLTATNLVVNTLISYNGGAATDFIGTATLNNGTVDVANTNIAAGDRIFLVHEALNASTEVGVLQYSIDPGVDFTINSLDPTDATVATGDLSTISYVIIRQV